MTSNNPRERLSRPAAEVIVRLPAIGRLMITARQSGATHERIGRVERIVHEDGMLLCQGAEHDSRIDPSEIATVTVDRTSIMGDKAYPRIDFADDAGTVLFSVVGFDGLEPFDMALAPLGGGVVLPVEARPERGERGEVASDDVGALPFAQASATGEPVSILFSRSGFSQAWHGTIEQVKPAMGFINVMRPDFHLHLKAGTVAGWTRTEAQGSVELSAVDFDGEPTGLVVTGRASAFQKAH